MTPEELRTLTLFNTVESSPGINQRQLTQGPMQIVSGAKAKDK